MSSTSVAAGMEAWTTSSGLVSGSVATTSRCSRLRPSTIEKKATILGRRSTSPATKSPSCANVRTVRVEGMRGTSRASAASKTLSETREMDGGQSSIVRS